MSFNRVVRLLFLSFGSLSLLVDGKRLLAENSRIIKVSNCLHKISSSGDYLFQFRQRSSHISSCEVFIQAPPRHLVRLKLFPVNVACDSPRLQLLDGYLIHSRFSGLRDFIPQSLATDPSKIVHICNENASQGITTTESHQSFLSSQNYAEISYSLRPHESFQIRVDFEKLPDDRGACNHIFEADSEFEVELGNDGQPSACQVYVNGAVALEVVALDFEKNLHLCDDTASNLLIKGSSQSWNSKTTAPVQTCNAKQCRKHYIAPCGHSTVELLSNCFTNERVKLNVRPLQDDEREPWTYYCY